MARKNPSIPTSMGMDMPQDKHENMLSEMHDALYTLGTKIRKPMPSNGEKLLPKVLQSQEPEGALVARAHIRDLHKVFRGAKNG